MTDTIPTEAEVAWAAGLYEGEGCASLERAARSITVTMSMTDEEPMRRFHKIVGVGIVKGPVCPPGDRKPYWIWRVRSWDQAEHIFFLLSPWLAPRRTKQFTDAFAQRPERLPDIPDCGYYKDRPPSNYGSIRHHRRNEVPCVGCRAAANEDCRVRAERKRGN